jgi:hypothetical protein
MIPDDPIIEYAVALTLTLLIETPLVAAALARWYRVPPVRGAILGLLASLMTHPVVWFVLPGLLVPAVGWRGYLLLAEGFAWLAEAALYTVAVSRLAARRDIVGMLLLSLLANLASFGVGAAVQLAGLW